MPHRVVALIALTVAAAVLAPADISPGAGAVAPAGSLRGVGAVAPAGRPPAVGAVAPARAVRAGTEPAADPLDRYHAQRLVWSACEPETPQLQCATFAAPRDWHRPGAGPDVTLAVSRLAGPGPAERPILVLDGGGPSSNLDLPLDYADTPLAAGYDLIGYDPRGIGRSSRIHCLTTAEIGSYLRVDVRDRSPGNVRRVLATARAIAAACATRSGELLRYVSTDQIVRDLDLVRALLGAPRTNFLGVSAGTWLGAHYAAVFPYRVGRFVLDSNTEFTATMQVVIANQAPAFERRFGAFLSWVAGHDGTYHYGRTRAQARARWEARRAALQRHPAPVTGSFAVRPADLDNVTAGLLYHQSDFPLLAEALSILERLPAAPAAERRLVAELFGSPPAGEGVLAMYLAVTCNDTPWTRDPRYWIVHSGQLGRRYPLQGYHALLQPCAFWRHRPAPVPPVAGTRTAPVLMVNSVGDPATPYQGALRAHRGLPGSRLLTVLGGDHGNYGRGNPCVDRVVHRYLLDGVLPAPDATCPGPPPRPGG